MAGLDDIPAHLHAPNMKPQFIKWLALMPLDPMIKRNLIARWRLHFHTTFTPADYAIALSTPTTKKAN